MLSKAHEALQSPAIRVSQNAPYRGDLTAQVLYLHESRKLTVSGLVVLFIRYSLSTHSPSATCSNTSRVSGVVRKPSMPRLYWRKPEGSYPSPHVVSPL